jgi:hypothetical protein
VEVETGQIADFLGTSTHPRRRTFGDVVHCGDDVADCPLFEGFSAMVHGYSPFGIAPLTSGRRGPDTELSTRVVSFKIFA